MESVKSFLLGNSGSAASKVGQVVSRSALLSAVLLVACAASGALANPIANEDYVSTAYASPVTINVLENDEADGASLDPNTIEIVSSPSGGELVLEGGVVHYSPSFALEGEDTFDYRVRDSNGNVSNTTTVYVVVDMNQPPWIEYIQSTYNSGMMEWRISGKAHDELLEWLKIEVGGIKSATLSVDENGNFVTYVVGGPDESMYINFQAVETAGDLTSIVEDHWLYPYY